MILVQFLVVLLFLYIGMRVGGIGVGFAGGAGVIVLSALGATPGDMPMLVIVFIMVVIVAIAAMQEAGWEIASHGLKWIDHRTMPAEEEAAQVAQSVVLYIDPSVDIPEGSKIIVTQNGMTRDYERSGKSAVYSCHQEVPLELFKEWA